MELRKQQRKKKIRQRGNGQRCQNYQWLIRSSVLRQRQCTPAHNVCIARIMYYFAFISVEFLPAISLLSNNELTIAICYSW